ncbi:MAG TPA: cobalamin biosynthesis protein [Nitrososphaeraceae archaeon]|jgi:adenosylcobinamide-phosphate synthase
MIGEHLIVALLIAIALDMTAGDPKNKYHPVRWLGNLINYFVPHLKTKTIIDLHEASRYAIIEKVKGTVFVFCLLGIFGVGLQLCLFIGSNLMGPVLMIIVYAIILKITIAIKGMEVHSVRIMNALEQKDLDNARLCLSMIVRRETKNLDEQLILSGTIECISESTVDGVVSPIFFYSLFGPTGSFIFRIVNTLDSMIGYKDKYNENIGWMSAKLDTIANYIPSRLAGMLIVVSSLIISTDWRNSIRTMRRDHNKTSSLNAGYPISSMAGSLRVKLEKVDHYSVGESYDPLSIEKCKRAIVIMKLTAILSCFLIFIPLMSILSAVGWWGLLFGS